MKVFEEAFAQGETATMYILDEMLKTQAEVAPELSPYAPLIMSMKIEEAQIRTVIGKG
jgi:polyribonucleotide nucleotidyltransferase